MELLVGTSGYSYKEWKGTFYPEKLPAAKMLSFYAEHFSTVEINNTFYRMPEPKMLEKWAGEVPSSFRFVLKAPQRITHQKKLVDVQDDLHFFFETASTLGEKLGPILFQLPPYARKDIEKLRAFIRLLPVWARSAFEFRHESWFDDETYDVLRSRNVALCAADTDEITDVDGLVVDTSDWGYVRLRRTEYSDQALVDWRRRIDRQRWTTAYVFFKHEDEGKGPAFARTFIDAGAGSHLVSPS